MTGQDRFNESRTNLMKILARRGVIYTLGLCIGILSRLSRYDYQLYQELRDRSKK
jgi:hypothetical protein